MKLNLAFPTGEYFSGRTGYLLGESIIRFARSVGYVVAPEDERYVNRVDHEGHYDVWDEAEEYLQGLIPEGDNRVWGPGPQGDGWGLWETEEE